MYKILVLIIGLFVLSSASLAEKDKKSKDDKTKDNKTFQSCSERPRSKDCAHINEANERFGVIEGEQAVQNDRLTALEIAGGGLSFDEWQEYGFRLHDRNTVDGTALAVRELARILGVACNLNGAFIEIEACTTIHTASGLTLDPGTLIPSTLIYLHNPDGYGTGISPFLFAKPGNDGWATPIYGRQANFTRDYRFHGYAYVDDCSAPTVMLIEEGRSASSGFGLDNGHVYLINMSLHVTEDGHYGNPIGQRTLSGDTIGRINHLAGPYLPLCETVTVEGVFDEYGIVFQADTSSWNPLTAD